MQAADCGGGKELNCKENKKKRNKKKEKKEKKNYSTLPSRLVSDVSTTKACWGLRSQSGRDARWPPEYDRSRKLTHLFHTRCKFFLKYRLRRSFLCYCYRYIYCSFKAHFHPYPVIGETCKTVCTPSAKIPPQSLGFDPRPTRHHQRANKTVYDIFCSRCFCLSLFNWLFFL